MRAVALLASLVLVGCAAADAPPSREVESFDPSLTITQRRLISINGCDGGVRTVLQLVAAYGDQALLVAPDVEDRSAPVSLQDVTFEKAIDEVARSTGLHVARIGSVTIVSSRAIPDAPPLGTAPPGTRVVLRGASARDALELLAHAAGLRLDGSPALRGRFDLALPGVSEEDALRAIAVAHGLEVTLDRAVVRVRGGAPPPREVVDLRPTIELPDGRSVDARLEGLVHHPGPAHRVSRALISGRIYAEGEPLRSAFGGPIAGLRVRTIDANRVVLDASGTRITLSVD